MADITKCKGTNCDLALTCYRYTAPKGYIQSYFTEVPLNKETNTCDEYWDNTNRNTKMTPENHIDVLSETMKRHIAEESQDE